MLGIRPLPLLATLATVLCISGGQMLFKITAARANVAHSLWAPDVLRVLVGACILYGAATLVWVSVLRYVPLSVAYVFMALSFIIVPLLSYAFFKETLSARYFVGLVLIVAGIIVSLTAENTS
jgi:undecaprenyl phosphate-alpha-L-ara4N flippase subunit ArnE